MTTPDRDRLIEPCFWCGKEGYDNVIGLEGDPETPRCRWCLNNVATEFIEQFQRRVGGGDTTALREALEAKIEPLRDVAHDHATDDHLCTACLRLGYLRACAALAALLAWVLRRREATDGR